MSVSAGRCRLQYVKMSDRARAPSRGSPGSAGFDLFSAEEVIVGPGERVCVKTDLQIRVPDGTYGRVAPRSGLALKHGIDVGAGVIDGDFRGNVMVLLFNLGAFDFHVRCGDRIAQLILEKFSAATPLEQSTLEETERGSGGFGSTGH